MRRSIVWNLFVLAMLCFMLAYLAGCSITATERAKIAELQLTTDLCSATWNQPITYDGKLDTQPTKAQIRRFNAGRAAFCHH